jgi:hypothetical protein
MFILIQRNNIGETSVSPKDSGIKGSTDDQSLSGKTHGKTRTRTEVKILLEKKRISSFLINYNFK